MGRIPTALLACGLTLVAAGARSGREGHARQATLFDASRQDAGGSQVKAEAILRRAAAAYAQVHALRASFTQEIDNPLLESHTQSRGTLYEERPGRLLLRFSDPPGDVVVSDGRYIWLYYPSVDPKQVIRSRGGAPGTAGLDLQAQFLGDPTERFAAKLDGAGQVDNRGADILTLEPRENMGYRSLRVWIDQTDHLVRQFEITDGNGVVRRFHLTDLAVNPDLSDSLFHFTPPPGVTVVDRG
jgi:outer membrane lipoprotein carrier protein